MFISEYLRDFNATRAAIRAGYSPKTARINELEAVNAAKDKRIRELEREVERLQSEVNELKKAQGI